MPEAPSIHIQTCPCGLQVKYKDKHVGRTLPCSNCGLDITLRPPTRQTVKRVVVEPEPLERKPDDHIALENPDIDLPGLALGAVQPVARDDLDAEEIARKNSERRKAETKAKRRAGGFWGDAVRAMCFLRTIDAVIKTLVLIVLLTIADIAGGIPFLGPLCALIANGTAITFFFNTIVYSAGGDTDLPDYEWDGWWESAIKPVLTMLFITLILAAPGIALIFAIPEVPLASPIAFIAMGFLWPVIMLMVALGGGEMAIRIDLAIRTIVSAPLPYLAIWLLLLIALAAQGLATSAGVGQLPDGLYELATAPIFGDFILNVGAVYLAISSMKIIGLYYRHFSDRFPWDAG